MSDSPLAKAAGYYIICSKHFSPLLLLLWWFAFAFPPSINFLSTFVEDVRIGDQELLKHNAVSGCTLKAIASRKVLQTAVFYVTTYYIRPIKTCISLVLTSCNEFLSSVFEWWQILLWVLTHNKGRRHWKLRFCFLSTEGLLLSFCHKNPPNARSCTDPLR